MEVIEYIIDEENEEGVYAISLVSAPAIESDFVMLSKDIKLKLVNEELGLLMGAALIPDLPILRTGEDGDYYIFFSKETIRKTSELFFQNGFQSETTLEHQTKLQGNTIVESWIKESDEHDKSNLFGIEAPVGSWIVSMKISDPEVLALAKKGVINGFSIEGLFADKTELSSADVVDYLTELIYNL